MSFDVHLVESSHSGEIPASAFDAALESVGARMSDPPGVIITSDGHEVEWFGGEGHGGMAAIRSMSTEVAGLVFAIADRTRCFVLSTDEPQFLRTPGNLGSPPEGAEDIGVVPVATPEDLGQILFGPFEKWAAYRDQVIASESAAPPPLPSRRKGLFSRLFGKS